MANRCINRCCESKFDKKLLAAKEPICKYYRVKGKAYHRVCETCLDNFNKQTEWIYQGSNKLANVNNQNKRVVRGTGFSGVHKILDVPYTELRDLTENEKSKDIVNTHNDNSKIVEVSTRRLRNVRENKGVIKNIKIPANCPKQLSYEYHQCSLLCMTRVQYDYSQTKYMNVLSIPFHYGFTRSKNARSKKVTYTTPCGCIINDEHEMFNYLKVTAGANTNNQMTIDLFNFDYKVNPLSSFSAPEEFVCIRDLSYEVEFKTISVVNCVDDLLPKEIEYISKRKVTAGVNLNTEAKFLCGCDCTDNCEDKTKCSCWQLTFESQKKYPNWFNYSNNGYIHKRLHNAVFTGIFECNDSCKCVKTCLNRVVQEPLKTSLQLFKTHKKGWGVRTLADIPKGSFVCSFVAEVRTQEDVDNESLLEDYMADLNFVDIVRDMKDGYESKAVMSSENENYTSPSDDDDFNPRLAVKSKITKRKSKRSVRKNLQDTNTKIVGKHRLSNLNIQQRVEIKHTPLLDYLSKDRDFFILDGNVCGNIGRFFNHSCDPNIFIQNVFVDTHDLRFPWVAYFAKSNIVAGTELALDYCYKLGDEEGKKLCFCYSKICRGRLL